MKLGRGGNDDVYVWGRASVVFPAIEAFKTRIQQHCSLILEPSKTQVFLWHGRLPLEAPEGMLVAGRVCEDDFLPGKICYGIPMGSTDYVRTSLMEKARGVAVRAHKVRDILDQESQALLCVLKASFDQQLDCHCSLAYPSDIKESAELLDMELWSVFEGVCGFHVPLGEEGLG